MNNRKRNVFYLLAILAALILMVVLFLFNSRGNESKEIEEAKYELKEPGMEILITYTYTDEDVIKKQTTKTTIVYEEVGGTEEIFKKQFDDMIGQYEGIDGLTYEVEYLKDKLVETISVDYEKVDIDQLQALEGVGFDKDTLKDMRLQHHGERLESRGFQRVE